MHRLVAALCTLCTRTGARTRTHTHTHSKHSFQFDTSKAYNETVKTGSGCPHIHRNCESQNQTIIMAGLKGNHSARSPFINHICIRKRFVRTIPNMDPWPGARLLSIICSQSPSYMSNGRLMAKYQRKFMRSLVHPKLRSLITNMHFDHVCSQSNCVGTGRFDWNDFADNCLRTTAIQVSH